ncbi:hypothetical protein ABPG75_010727 [Micractinium tetrahymenae]
MEDWLVSDFDWDPRALAAGELTFGAPQPGLSCSEGVLGSSQTASQLTAGSADGSGGSEPAPAPPPHAAPRSGGRKGRRPRSGRTPASCQVEGCGISLEGGKPFYRLQRICETHARAQFVTDASGRALRFCQQCTRLHPVTEFEGSKRSCAVSLQRRMERKHRQKRAAESADAGGGPITGAATLRTRGASTSRTHAASAYLAGVSSGDGSTPSRASPSTSGGGAHLSQHSGGHSGVSAGDHAAPVQAPEPQSSLGMVPAAVPAGMLPVLGGETASAGGLMAGGLYDQAAAMQQQQQQQQQQRRRRQEQLMAEAEMHAALTEGLPQVPAPAPATAVLGAGAGAAMQPYGGLQGGMPANIRSGSVWPSTAAPPPQQLAVPSLTAAEIDQLLVMEPDDLAAALLARVNTDATPAAAADLPSSALDALESALSVNCLPDMHHRMAQGMLGMVLASLAPKAEVKGAPVFDRRGAAPTFDRPPADFGLPRASLPLSLPLAPWPAALEAAALTSSAGAPLPQALAAATADPMSLEAEPLVVRFSLKVYGLTPSQLPPHLRLELESALATSPTIISGAVRSGCTHLTADVLLSSSEAAAVEHPGGSAAALARLLRGWQAAQAWRLPAALPLLRVVAQAETDSAGLLLQPLEQLAEGASSEGGAHSRLAAAGGVVCPLVLGGAGAGTGSAQQLQRLQLAAAGPVATTVGAARGRFVLRCPDWQQLVLGEEQAASRRVLHCRSRGRHVVLALLRPGEPEAAEEACVAEDEAEEEHEEEVEAGSDSDEEAAVAAEAAEAEEERRLRLRLQQAPGAEVWVPAAAAQWGLFEFELASGPLLGTAAPVLVLPDEMEAAAAELQQLQQGAAEAAAAQLQLPGSQQSLQQSLTTRVLRLVNSVLLFLEEGAAAAASRGEAAAAAQQRHAAAYPPAARQRLAAAATWLCALCVRLRFPELLRALLPATTACGGAAEAVAAMDALLPAGTLGTAAAAGSAPLLAALADWAASAGHSWQLTGAGSRGLTPLHLAASLGPRLSAGAAAALVAAVGQAAAAECWASARASGWTPGQVATAAGTAALLDLLGSQPAHVEPEAAATEADLPAPRKSGHGSAAEAERLRRKQAALEEEEADEAGLQKQGGLPLGLDKAHGMHAAPAVPRLPATAAEVQAWRQRAMQPAVLLAIGGAAILLALGLAAALRSAIYA